MRVEAEYAKMQDAPRHPYLENERALPASLLGSGTFRRPGAHRCARQCGVPAFRSGRALRLRDQEQRLHRLRFGRHEGLVAAVMGGPTITGWCSAKARLMRLSHAVLFPDERARYALDWRQAESGATGAYPGGDCPYAGRQQKSCRPWMRMRTARSWPDVVRRGRRIVGP